MLDELLPKIAMKQDLSPMELEELRLISKNLEHVRRVCGGWIGINGQPSVGTIRATHTEFEIAPIDGFYATRVGNQSVNDNTETNVAFNASSAFGTDYYSRPYSDGSKIKLLNVHHTIGVFGTIEWETNGTGRRGIHLNLYDADDNLLTGNTLHSLPGSGLDVNTLPLAGGFWLPAYNEGTNYPTLNHVRLTVIQTSGGALNVQNVRAFFFAVK